ncbi:MAG: hydantoinase/oxoprolinase family protein [Euryarchaeota archaeon]|nr:hydantoinase/oxoprolinase family protein [Euryarchaeota archaeon]HQM67401.1 hydantoinase/oxoprolinase family protein [Methanomassiliicoccales archaeon]
MELGLGIDTGGTYTDAALVELGTGKVIAKAKALTTRNDLSIGIAGSLRNLGDVPLKDVKLVSLSSTLATNSVVEGKGCRVALIIAGDAYNGSVPVDHIIQVQGGHTIRGVPNCPIDLQAVEEYVAGIADQVDAIAISTFFSVRNPEHEIALKRMITSKWDLPVVCGHELSTQLGFQERTLTAILNAKLIPIMAELIQSVKKVLEEDGIKAPLMIVKGDGSLMGEQLAKERPVETILSGPAASLIGARNLTGENDAVVVDVGGTTTDIGVLRGGRPRLDPEGAIIGGWRTRVRAADISTSGIGGDSRVVVVNGQIMLGTLRVMPLCIASSQYPRVLERLRKLKDVKQTPQATHIALESILQADEFFIFSRMVKGYEPSENERALIDLIRTEPKTLYEISEATGVHPYSYNVRKLEELGVITRIGFTPTDALHASGEYVEYDREAPLLSAEYRAGLCGMDVQRFCAEVKEAVIQKIAREIVYRLIYEDCGKTVHCDVCSSMIDKMVSQLPGIDFSVDMRLHRKIIGIGAPIGAYLPSVAQRLHTELLMPENSDVGNAVGAITGSIMESVEVLIKPKPGLGVMEDPPCTMHSMDEMREFETMSEAAAYAKSWGENKVRRNAVTAGADEIEVLVENHRMMGQIGKSWGDGLTLEVHVKVTAVGKPRMFFEVEHGSDEYD